MLGFQVEHGVTKMCAKWYRRQWALHLFYSTLKILQVVETDDRDFIEWQGRLRQKNTKHEQTS